MESTPAAEPIFDEAKYRHDVLGVTSAESEQARAQQLAEEARQLGLRVPGIAAASGAPAPTTSGMADFSSPVLSSGSSTDRNSVCDGSITPSYEPLSPSQLDQVATSMSEITIASARVKPGSMRSLASWSGRPTSYCSSEGRPIVNGIGIHHDGLAATKWADRRSMLSIASSDQKEKRKSSLRSALERLPFGRKRTSPGLIAPSDSRIAVSRDNEGVDRVYLEPSPDLNGVPAENRGFGSTVDSLPRLEVPTFDQQALQRSRDDPELSEMVERHQMERDRHIAFQNAALSILRRRQEPAIPERQSEYRRQEDEKQEKNITAAARLEERQLAIEIEQQREFERAKVNSSIRIKHMEGYFRNASPPPAIETLAAFGERSDSFSESDTTTPPPRRFTRQDQEQLEQQYLNHESMDQLHEARIKVLRERQELRLQETILRMDQELENMCDRHTRDIEALRSEHQREESSLVQALDTKKTALQHRWHLEEMILRRQHELQYGRSYGPLPPVSFTNTTNTRDSAICVPRTPSSLRPRSANNAHDRGDGTPF
ncbi:hypothetical protein NUU61_000583 [Penicillium alfredii]|uniref:Uncharacterized protein n=1 Tax=Penicillium alfredii TaxID=1506179 RepID=A0A9W9KPV7_9EURO|nr:uncharacterized protein NUU61_000583 [Penicillium alfredii]KAJ5114824.1 hypothetical protein NUU61_000583 [Penicillium alfredii]